MAQRIVLKFGTNVLIKNNRLNKGLIAGIAKDLSEFRRQGNEFIIVTSGAIGLGIEKLCLDNNSLSLEEQQACAAVGQSILMSEYNDAFSKYNQAIAQLLLTNENFLNPEQSKNLNNTLEKLLRMNVIPVINENDSVSTSELRTEKGFSDNDTLAALVAVNSKASLLVLFTDVDSMYDKDPKKFKGSKSTYLLLLGCGICNCIKG